MACVGGVVWVVRRGGVIGDLREAVEGCCWWRSRWWGSRTQGAKADRRESNFIEGVLRPNYHPVIFSAPVSRAISAGLIACFAVLFCRLESGPGDAGAAVQRRR